MCAGYMPMRGFAEYREATAHLTRAHGIPTTDVRQLHARLLLPGPGPGHLIQFRCLFCCSAADSTERREEGTKFAALPEQVLLGHIYYNVGDTAVCKSQYAPLPCARFLNSGPNGVYKINRN
jgi:hypothetical protein